MFTLIKPLAEHSNALTVNADLFDSTNGDILARDKTQSNRLHEPYHRINTIDPITGRDIKNVASHPSLEDGNLTVYFESENTKRAYLKMPMDHPNPYLPYPASDEDDRGG